MPARDQLERSASEDDPPVAPGEVLIALDYASIGGIDGSGTIAVVGANVAGLQIGGGLARRAGGTDRHRDGARGRSCLRPWPRRR
jgi:hypothetical protein